ncbi:MAG: hypothetical protein EZS28_028591, partial [Streblomastix strix]
MKCIKILNQCAAVVNQQVAVVSKCAAVVSKCAADVDLLLAICGQNNKQDYIQSTYNNILLANYGVNCAENNSALSKSVELLPRKVHQNFQIQQIHNPHISTVKLAQHFFHKKMRDIVKRFTLLYGIHPFFVSLLNVLKDKDHY